MIDWLKTNWKAALLGACVSVVVLSLICCGGEEEPAIIEEPAVEEVIEEVTPVTE